MCVCVFVCLHACVCVCVCDHVNIAVITENFMYLLIHGCIITICIALLVVGMLACIYTLL